MAVKWDFVADFGFAVVYPCIRRVGQHLAFEVGFDVLAQGYVFSVAQGGVGLGLAFCLPFSPSAGLPFAFFNGRSTVMVL